MNKYYNCFSFNQMKYLVENKINPKRVSKHHSTNKTIWVFEMNKDLSMMLVKWTTRGKQAEKIAV